MTGREAIRAYWRAEVVERQDDISFGSDVLHVEGDRAFVHWWVSYVRVRDGERFRLDGAFVLEFDQGSGLCRSLREWWHGPSLLSGLVSTRSIRTSLFGTNEHKMPRSWVRGSACGRGYGWGASPPAALR
jgi:SnoaL-like domain